MFGGAWAIIIGALWNVANLEDQGPRCLGGCDPSATQYYWTVYEVSTLIVVAGVVAVFVGLWLLTRSSGLRSFVHPQQ